MSAVSRALSRRGTLNTMENMDRDEFDRILTTALNKAINSQETPVKEKHVRTLILASYKEKGAGSFWINVIRLQIEASPVLSWKFCHVMHKLLRDGHRNVISDSLKYRSKLVDLGKLWSHLKEGYGPLILQYCKLLLTKLEFHHRNIRVPGTLQMTDDELEALGEKDVNNWFELSVEMLDYVEDLLGLQRLVFNSLDMSRASSMTASGQCRLAPLIICILDSSMLYDYIVKMLFKLYAALPPDVLAGHRDRFNNLFKGLKQFYYTSSNLQYFKYLVSIPALPENPPNFIIASDFENYVTPEVRIHDRELEQGFDNQTPPDGRSVASLPLVEISNNDAARNHKYAEESLLAEVAEKDKAINTLRHDLDDVKATLHYSQVQTTQSTQKLQKQILDLQNELLQEKELIEQLSEENERYRTQAEQLQNEKNQHTAAKLEETEKKAQTIEDKLRKTKEAYTKLREEHIETLKKFAALQKDFECTRKSAEDFATEKITNEALHRELVQNHQKLQEEMQCSASSTGQMVVDIQRLREQLEERNKDLESLTSKLENEQLSNLERQGAMQLSVQNLNSRLDSLKKLIWSTFETICDQCLALTIDTIDQLDHPAHLGVTCSPEFMLSLIPTCIDSLDRVSTALSKVSSLDDEINDDIVELSGSVIPFVCTCAEVLLHGKATANAAPSNQFEEIGSCCTCLGVELKSFFPDLKNKDKWKDCAINLKSIKSTVEKLLNAFQSLVGKMGDISSDELSGMFEKEMKHMDAMVLEACSKIQQILIKSNQENTGVRLEVNGKILDACTALMLAIIQLVQKSRDLQDEIVRDGRGTSSNKDFYARHHLWTEGLVSAAKNVGVGARILVDAADQATSTAADSGDANPLTTSKTTEKWTTPGRFEPLLAASQQIAAGTAQLVVASRVKADKSSERLAALSAASRQVTGAMADVLAVVKSSREIFEQKEALDFSNLSLHQAKRMEMEVQVKVLELESNLEKERRRLAEIRKVNYHLAEASES